MGRVQDKVAMVTGAARGIGAAVAALLAREGARVMATDVDVDTGEACVQAIRAAGGSARFLRHDVRREEDWRTVMERTLAEFTRLDVLVNNAGVGIQKSVEDTTLEEWRGHLAVNLDGVYLGTRCAIAAMKASGGGSIINIASIEAMVGHPHAAAYNAAKGGVRSFTKSAALYCAEIGSRIRVNSVHPGFVRTPLLEHYLGLAPDPAAARRQLDAAHPLGFLGEPEDVAYGVLYLACDESRWVTGSELVIDGGYLAR